jgi:hypothetical protein
VKENDAGSVICLEARLKDMNPETIDVIDEARSYAQWEKPLIEWQLGRTRG